MPNQWDAQLYDRNHAFVSELATDLIELLALQQGDRLLDLGCSTGGLIPFH
ncbi:hypothetical protein [Chroococcidiopsis sp. TS-821]|uniref:hypothetical protein n=1 Tax=Chroococcidiopsis sp. TS-821 TaxID=1378066 RepID=UPI001AEFD412|nr:hypothetical protein [Chroococcidiopsis sp. TS-821]